MAAPVWQGIREQLTVNGEQLTVNSEQLTVNSEQLSVNGEQLTVNSGQWTVVGVAQPENFIIGDVRGAAAAALAQAKELGFTPQLAHGPAGRGKRGKWACWRRPSPKMRRPTVALSWVGKRR
ncbi:MAG: hypothetical protein M5U34_01205 [Chloroflexi bacterium]|nr:hypothetical protein [Chloroflexota bacterium]